ncbi:hypothetical protein B0H14DRAFT_2634061 [Mycena olivaceomarginata]|nr:hypothetical protein B0H14DRAFT_2634061 [Mycena olivaceomarginata]
MTRGARGTSTIYNRQAVVFSGCGFLSSSYSVIKPHSANPFFSFVSRSASLYDEHKRRRQREREWRSSLTTRVEVGPVSSRFFEFCRVNPALSCTESHTETAKALLFASVAKFRGGGGGQSDGAKIAVEREEDLGPHLRGEAGCHPHYALQGLLEHASTILSPNARRPPSTSRVTAELAQYAPRTIFADAACAMGCRETLASWGAIQRQLEQGQRKLIHGWQSGGGQILLSGVLKCLDQLRGEDVDGVEHGWQTSGLWFIRALVLQRSAQAAEIRNGVILEGGGLVDGKNGRKRRRPTCPDPNAESEKQGY